MHNADIKQLLDVFRGERSASGLDLLVKNPNPLIEKLYFVKCKLKIDRLSVPLLVSFDFDGTVLSNFDGENFLIRYGFKRVCEYCFFN